MVVKGVVCNGVVGAGCGVLVRQARATCIVAVRSGAMQARLRASRSVRGLVVSASPASFG